MNITQKKTSSSFVVLQWTAIEKINSEQSGKAGYLLLWFLGVPLPVLVIWYLFFGSR